MVLMSVVEIALIFDAIGGDIPVCWRCCLIIWMRKLLLGQSQQSRKQWITSHGLTSSGVSSWTQGELTLQSAH